MELLVKGYLGAYSLQHSVCFLSKIAQGHRYEKISKFSTDQSFICTCANK